MNFMDFKAPYRLLTISSWLCMFIIKHDHIFKVNHIYQRSELLLKDRYIVVINKGVKLLGMF